MVSPEYGPFFGFQLSPKKVFQLIYKQTVSTGTASSFIYLVVFVMKKRLLSLVASLGNMVRVTWSNNSRHACHKEWYSISRILVNN